MQRTEEYNTLMPVHHQGSINSFIMCVDSLIQKCHQNNTDEKTSYRPSMFEQSNVLDWIGYCKCLFIVNTIKTGVSNSFFSLSPSVIYLCSIQEHRV